MLRCCIVCRAEASPELTLQYCAACQSALYCSKACQRKDWRKQHKKLCKLLNVGHGDMQVRRDVHTRLSFTLEEFVETEERYFDEEDKRFFKLFEESTFEGSRAAARKMRTIAERHTKHDQTCLLFQSLTFLVRSDSEKLSWPNSPLLLLLQFVDPNVLCGDEHQPLDEGEVRLSPLHLLADLADPSDYSTHENQLILASQLIDHGANANVVSNPEGKTPLHNACYAGNVTNLDFVELLLEAGADPNSQDHLGLTPLFWTNPDAPGAAKFLLNWSTTDVNITARSGASFLATVRQTVTYIYNKVTLPDNPDQVQDQFALRQWRKIEKMLVERGATDTGITNLV
jgi:hypothetical protein